MYRIRHIIEVITMSEPMPTLLHEIVALRKDSGLTQQQLADRSGIPQPSIGRIETGRTNPKLSTLLQLVHALGGELSIKIPPERKAVV